MQMLYLFGSPACGVGQRLQFELAQEMAEGCLGTLLTMIPPSEWHTKRIGLSVAPSNYRRRGQ